MISLTEEIRESFAQSSVYTAIELKTTNPAISWVIRGDNWYGVGIPNDNHVLISEKFANVKLWSNTYQVDGVDRNLLLLTSTNESLRYEFATICSEFCAPGDLLKQRDFVASDPLAWWKRWKALIGNFEGEKAPYSLIGELLTLEKLLIAQKNPTWSAAKFGTHDIETTAASYEVKSTIKRYEATITVNSQHQLQVTSKDLFLIFCRLEESEHGDSIDELKNRIIALGYNADLLEKGICNCGYELGSHERKIKYIAHEARKYVIDDDFPRITKDSFVKNKIPAGIIKIVYDVDLNGIGYQTFS